MIKIQEKLTTELITLLLHVGFTVSLVYVHIPAVCQLELDVANKAVLLAS